MPGELSTFGAAKVLDAITGRAFWKTAPFSTYAMLLTAVPDDDATLPTLAELTTGGYTRAQVTWSAATATSPSTISNSTLLGFGALTADMVQPAVAVALTTTATGTAGDYLMWWSLDQPMQIQTGQQLQIAPGKLSMTLT